MDKFRIDIKKEKEELELALKNLADAGFQPHDMHVKCQVCRFGRKLGDAEITAKTQAVKHALRNVHRVKVFDHGSVAYIVDPRDRMQDFDDVPPF